MTTIAPFEQEHAKQYIHVTNDKVWRVWQEPDANEWKLVSFDGRTYDLVATASTLRGAIDYFKWYSQ